MSPRLFPGASSSAPIAALAIAVLIGAGLGCNRSGAKLRDAASEDLRCPPSNIHIIGASRTKDVTGCGHSATYKFEDGEWYMVSRDGAAVQAGQPQPQPKAGPPAVAPAQPAQPTTGTPSMPPSSPPPPSQKL
jgi:hypothetical protein